jgi:predicted protein tyrosine phosphatase
MIRVFSREEIIDWYECNPLDSTPVISVNDIGYDSPVPKDNYNVLKLFFDDVTPYNVKHNLIHPYYQEAKRHRSLVMFDKYMANDIACFVKNIVTGYYEKEADIYIHCHAGVSRSVAIAFAIHSFVFDVFGEVVGVDYDDCRMNSFVFAKLYKELYYAL